MIKLENISNYGDILAIPFFFMTTVYFYSIQNKSFTEYFIFIFSIFGLLCDIVFTWIFLYNLNINDKPIKSI